MRNVASHRCGFLALLFIAWLGAAHAADDGDAPQPNKCTLHNAATLPMLDGYPGRVVVALSVAGQPRRFLVDTGAVFTLVYQHLVDELNLPTRDIASNIEVYNLQGARARRYATLPSLALGSLSGSDMPVLVEPEPRGTQGIDGILAPDILSKFDLDFDFANRKFNLVMPDHCPGNVVYWANSFADADFDLRDSHIVLAMTLDGKDVTATLDTGSVTTHLFAGAARRLFDVSLTPPTFLSVRGRGHYMSDWMRHDFKLLSIGGLAVSNPAIYILPNYAAMGFARDHGGELEDLSVPRLDTTDLLLGMDVIGKLHLYIAYKEHKLYLTDAAAHLPP